MFYCRCFILSFLFSPRYLRAPSADRRGTLPRDGKYVHFCNPSPKIWGTSPKNIAVKNVQYYGRLRTTSNFDRGYPRNGQRYPKSENYCIDSNSSCVGRKKSGELWSTNNKLEMWVWSLDPQKSTFSENHISVQGSCGLKFLHALENDQGDNF